MLFGAWPSNCAGFLKLNLPPTVGKILLQSAILLNPEYQDNKILVFANIFKRGGGNCRQVSHALEIRLIEVLDLPIGDNQRA